MDLLPCVESEDVVVGDDQGVASGDAGLDFTSREDPGRRHVGKSIVHGEGK